LLKHATISFGQSLPESVLAESCQLSENADLFFAIGSSLVVEPAASLPRIASHSGARLVIINRDPTPLDELADVVVHESIGAVLTAIDTHTGS
jgi:NAD-dependent deacetylase